MVVRRWVGRRLIDIIYAFVCGVGVMFLILVFFYNGGCAVRMALKLHSSSTSTSNLGGFHPMSPPVGL